MRDKLVIMRSQRDIDFAMMVAKDMKNVKEVAENTIFIAGEGMRYYKVGSELTAENIQNLLVTGVENLYLVNDVTLQTIIRSRLIEGTL